MDKALSNSDIEKMIKTKVLIYPDLFNYKNIYDILKPNGNFVLLYLTKENYGHWVCVIDHGKSIEFFDSYGIKPDLEFKQIENRKELDEPFNYLSFLLLMSNKKIEYNSRELQEYSANISTCGRHCVMRILMKDIPIDEYGKILSMDLNKTPDQIVTEVINL